VSIPDPIFRNPLTPLWDPGQITLEITEGAIHRVMGAPHLAWVAAIADFGGIEQIGKKVVEALEHPKPLDISLHVFNAVLAAQYYEIFEALRPPRSMSLYEPCVGASKWFPWDLFYNLIPMARGWIAECGLPLTEIRLPGVDPQWWMILQIDGDPENQA